MLLLVVLNLPSLATTRFFAAGYHEVVHDHFNNPRNVGSLDKEDPIAAKALPGVPISERLGAWLSGGSWGVGGSSGSSGVHRWWSLILDELPSYS